MEGGAVTAAPRQRPSTALTTSEKLLSFVLSGAKRSRRALALSLLIGLAIPVHADSNRPPAPYAYKQLPDARQEAQATALMGELRCLVCQGQSIHDSDAEMAGDMRHLVRTRIAAGESPEEVRSFLIDRYGSWVSYQPRLDRDTWFLWAFPLLLLLGGGWLVLRRLKVRR